MSLQKINEKQPLVHCLTNYVAANLTANGLLAVGASPIMADALEEAADMARQSNALLLNLGTLNERTNEAMLAAGISANQEQIPVVLDPVGAGATAYRTKTALRLLERIDCRLIRCNQGELAAISAVEWHSKGVDSGSGQASIEELARTVAKKYTCFVIVTGETDILTDGQQFMKITGGNSKITQITGTGCLLSALCAALLGSSDEPFTDLAQLLKEYKQLAEQALASVGTMQANLLDELEKKAGESQ